MREIRKLHIRNPKFTEDIYSLNPKNLYVLSLGVLEGILTDGKKVIFVKQTVTSVYAIASRLGYYSTFKAIRDGAIKITYLDELRIGRWIFRRGDLEKGDKFREKYGLNLGGVTTTTSYDLRGEIVR